MKNFCGQRNAKGEARVLVLEPGQKSRLLAIRLDLYNHSPDGFEWGYGGSGPAQLALAILADVLKAPFRKHRSSWWDEKDDDPCMRAVRLHQEFKRKFIAGLDRDQPWTISEQAVQMFIKQEESGT
jgi:hypothetical protein